MAETVESGQEGSVRVLEDGVLVPGGEEITVLNFTGAPGVTITAPNQANVPAGGGGGGEANTGSNLGVGVGVFDGKVGVDLQFRSLVAASTKISIALDALNDEIDFDVAEGNIVHQNLSGAGTNTHAQIDSHISSTANPHSTSIANIGSGTLAQLNSAVSDATLIDTGDSRLSDDRTADGLRTATTVVSISAATAPSSGQVLTASSSTLAAWSTPTVGSHALGGSEHTSDTLANLNAKITDATLDDSSATRDPNAHALGGAAHTSATLAQLNALVSDATLIDTGDARLSDDRTASGLRTATTVVAISSATAPSVGQVLKATSSTAATWQNEAGGVADLDGAYDGGRTITVDAGPIVLNVSTTAGGALDINPSLLAETAAQIDIAWAAGAYTGTTHGIIVDYGTMTSLTNAADVYGVRLVGETNAGAGDSIGVSIDAGFDQGIENASTLVQTALATFSGGVTSSAGEVLFSGGNAQLNDGIVLSFGDDDDVSLSWANATGVFNGTAGANVTDIRWDMTGATNADFTVKLDTNSAALFQVLNASDATLFSVAGDGTVTGVSGTSLTPTTDIKTANHTASVGELVMYDTSAGTFTITAPATPSNGDRFGVKNADPDFSVAVTIDGNSTNIENPNAAFDVSSITSFDVAVDGLGVEWVYSSAASAWVVS
ncbi:MAG: hypothetical protein GTO22_14510 [Gemmatimonadales bacterium]|nr:hypothetical protein [Gemmatimonadales bacterium]